MVPSCFASGQLFVFSLSHPVLGLCFSFCFCLAMAEMVEWPALLKKEGLSKIPFNKVVSTYRSPDEFRSCFANADHLEQYIKGLLTLGEAPLATADDWAFHPMAGTLRPLREKCIKGAKYEQGAQVADEVQK